ncbi:YifB family Mg chelatase-like AAA ATPase [Amphibiibacter pelophylacis]|uniref:YifB family Mg chelatase-like AAA ATPase n=1 Tax=Amphibiibacter pelophylacis TaxID=1799477 RepID=A0ACC6P477_9BURK
MSLAVIHSRALDGLHAPRVSVEVHVVNGLPSLTLVGLADTEVKEARERVRSALLSCDLPYPTNKRITVNLAPADLPKESGRFDLPIALGILVACGHLAPEALDGAEFAGELSLAGDLRPVRGALALALAVRRDHDASGASGQNPPLLVLPTASALQAAQVPGVNVRSSQHLGELVLALQAKDAHARDLPAALPLASAAAPPTWPDLLDVKGHGPAKRALEVAAAGGHSLLLVGPPGSGKSMLAQRLMGLLPPMRPDEALASAALAGLASQSGDDTPALGQRPWRSPHHSASSVALVGGGSPPRPGEVSLAHAGVLFLDELPEFPRQALEALREPLETRRISIVRAARRAEFPCDFQLVAAMNPCPCGWRGAALGTGRVCQCPPQTVARYQGRLSGPLIDRIDLQIEVQPVPPGELLAHAVGEPSQRVAQRVAQARERAWQRQGCANAALAPSQIPVHCALDDGATPFLRSAAERLGWSGRSLHRAIKVARTLADLAGRDTVGAVDVAEAIQYRRALVGVN